MQAFRVSYEFVSFVLERHLTTFLDLGPYVVAKGATIGSGRHFRGVRVKGKFSGNNRALGKLGVVNEVRKSNEH